MKLQKAIDRNVELKAELIKEGRLEKAEAVQLGIEALKFYECIKADGLRSKDFLLPGETKD